VAARHGEAHEHPQHDDQHDQRHGRPGDPDEGAPADLAEPLGDVAAHAPARIGEPRPLEEHEHPEGGDERRHSASGDEDAVGRPDGDGEKDRDQDADGDAGATWSGGLGDHHGDEADHGRHRDVEAPGHQHEDLPHGDDAEDRRAPQDVLEVADAEELRGKHGRHRCQENDGNPHTPVGQPVDPPARGRHSDTVCPCLSHPRSQET
jgi:hypothetical protein